MVVECAACHTRFKLADEKMKPGGTKVRCSKCKHVFTVMPSEPVAAPEPTPITPEPPRAMPAATAAPAAASVPPLPEPVPPAPEPVSPVPEPAPPAPVQPSPPAPPALAPAATDEFDFGEFNMEPVGGEEKAPPGDSGTFTDELDLGGFGEEPETEAEAPEFPFEEESGGPVEFDFDEGTETPPAAPGAGGEAAVHDEFAFEESFAETFSLGDATAPAVSAEEMDEFALGDEEMAPPAADFTFREEETEAGEFAFGGDEKGTGAAEFSFGEEQAPAAPEFAFDEKATEEEDDFAAAAEFSWESEPAGDDFAFGQPTQEQESADEFDFGGLTFDDEPVAPAPPVPPVQLPAAAEHKPPGPERQAAAVETLRPQRETVPPPPRRAEPIPAPVPAVRRRKTNIIGRLLFVLVLLLLAMLGTAVYFYWRGDIPELTRLVDRLTGQEAPPPVSGEIRIEALVSSYLTNRQAGQLLVIRGEAINDYPQARSSITVKGVLLDKAGNILLQQTVFAGNPLNEAALKSLSFAKIEESMNNPFGESLSNLNVAPGKTIPFVIVFRNLPPDLAEFTVEVVDSKPGTKQ